MDGKDKFTEKEGQIEGKIALSNVPPILVTRLNHEVIFNEEAVQA
ncbi:hypothetical protein [Paenibacillus lactis]|jgi:hypothetical protein|nr:hypothetical protein [Paenibacillus lactis]